MAQYKDSKYISYSSDDAFDKVHKPGNSTPHSGIYRCEGCGDEVASNAGNPLPSQNHKQHSTSQGEIRWRLVVKAVTK